MNRSSVRLRRWCTRQSVRPRSLVSLLLLDTGLRTGEALRPELSQVKLERAQGPKFGYVTVFPAKPGTRSPAAIRSAGGREDVSDTMGRPRRARLSPCGWIAGPNSDLGQQYSRARTPQDASDFVLHSLRHTFGTRLGESGADAFTIMMLMGHSTVRVSQRYVHPSPEAVDLTHERMTAMNLRRLPRVSQSQVTNPDKLLFFSMPGWRNRQTQRT